VKEFEPVTLLSKARQILEVEQQRCRSRSVQDLIKLAKSKPGKLVLRLRQFVSRIAGEMFKQMTGTYILSIPYRSNPPGRDGPDRRQIDMMIPT
jgi:tripartite-type tricarboxylate transporter receptor subunit TctC